MIRPRPTTYWQALRESDYSQPLPQPTLRPIAHCDICNAKLSRYRFPGETRCAPCTERHLRSIPAVELHPPIHVEHYTMDDCPGCGGRKDRKARLCHKCRYKNGRSA